MYIRKFFLLATILCSVCSLNAQRHEQLLKPAGNSTKEKPMELKLFHLMILNGNLSVFHTTGPFMDRLTVIMIYKM